MLPFAVFLFGVDEKTYAWIFDQASALSTVR
jgi:hypothetical protein